MAEGLMPSFCHGFCHFCQWQRCQNSLCCVTHTYKYQVMCLGELGSLAWCATCLCTSCVGVCNIKLASSMHTHTSQPILVQIGPSLVFWTLHNISCHVPACSGRRVMATPPNHHQCSSAVITCHVSHSNSHILAKTCPNRVKKGAK